MLIVDAVIQITSMILLFFSILKDSKKLSPFRGFTCMIQGKNPFSEKKKLPQQYSFRKTRFSKEKYSRTGMVTKIFFLY